MKELAKSAAHVGGFELVRKITDAAAELAKLAQLTSVNLEGCSKITDAAVAELAKLTQLTSVNLSECDNITDAGVKELAKLTQLTSVNLAGAARSPTRA